MSGKKGLSGLGFVNRIYLIDNKPVIAGGIVTIWKIGKVKVILNGNQDD